ncbi:MAG: glycosyltransferase family 39 protein [Cephaloticoccus sp.]|nr:glycosyltransferase family 39 protein [Cephaloticoccus sp.]MCF7759722.1 glycosyltransferase family 39 protein [Cephaloticoccus sp.]
MFQRFIKDRRLWLFGLTGLLAFAVARWVFPPNSGFHLVVKCGYWLLLVNVALFGRALWRIVRDHNQAWRPGKADFWALILVLAAGSLWQAHEERGFKILSDEVLMLGTSMDLHYIREATYPIRATDVQGPFQVLQGVLDKRPLLFPFVVSLIHDVTGYRATNPFYVNVVLGYVFLGLIYLLGTQTAGTRWGGALGVILFTGLPLMAQQAAGGGFELLNLVMLLVVLWLALRYAEHPEEKSGEALGLATVLLAQTRYESALFILPITALLIWGWAKAGRVVLPWSFWLLPVLLMPVVLQNRQFASNSSLWEMAGQGGGATEPFGLSYLPDNLGHALAFFFDTSGFQPNSIFFAVLGLLALPLLGIWIVRTLREPHKGAATDVALALVCLGLFGVTALFMIYFWGQFDHPVIRRLSLPLHLLMFLAIMVVMARWLRRRLVWQVTCTAAVVALLIQGLPAMAKRAYEMEYTPGVEMAWRAEFLNRFPERTYLFIDQDSVFWVTQHIAATPIKQAQLRKDGLAYHLRNHSFSAMYAFQRYQVDEETGGLTIDPTDDLGSGFTLEPVWQKRVSTLRMARISRITAIEAEGQISKATEYVEPGPEPLRSTEELQKAKSLYLENWIKQLP